MIRMNDIRTARIGSCLVALTLVAACSEPFDYDLRGKMGGFSTSQAARTATEARPKPDANGIISYPNYQVAVARTGDTVTTLANRIGLTPAEVATYNGLQVGDPLRAGEVVALPRRVGPGVAAPGSVDIATLAGNAIDTAPATPGAATTTGTAAATAAGSEPVRHKVERGETAYTIARLYNVPVKALADWNGLDAEFTVREGQYLLIPVTTAAAPKAAAASTTQPGQGSPTPLPPSAAKPLPAETIATTPIAEAPKPSSTVALTPTAKSSARMSMPVSGSIVRPYSKGKNDGIDIAAAPGTAVHAAEGGTVAAITADADQVPILVLRHPDNVLTVYANVQDIKVKKGDTVSKGQSIAQLRSGDNAYVHFEVRKGFESVDPMPYLQ
ncbi:peptidoglycan DD-metalloendopeptidase family protein [Chachezhania sediminis]|uniref:peptidoglycan DD-metalloendopeptidase family protein n=1 Tax=Chachezhania sediminis TaxID=2599291 RepID=UPI00131A76EA|nr:peptidoglycan DD-metalloendopeptidase family protein [Chachezhania sediminis]